MMQYLIIAGSLFICSLIFAYTVIKITQIQNPPPPPPKDSKPLDEEWKNKIEADINALKIQSGVRKLRP